MCMYLQWGRENGHVTRVSFRVGGSLVVVESVVAVFLCDCMSYQYFFCTVLCMTSLVC